MAKSSMKDVDELKTKVALGNRIMFHQGLADYHGHVSARIPGTRKFLIKPVLAPLGEISSRDIIVVDIDQYMEVCEENYAKAGTKRAITKLKKPPRETLIRLSACPATLDWVSASASSRNSVRTCPRSWAAFRTTRRLSRAST